MPADANPIARPNPSPNPNPNPNPSPNPNPNPSPNQAHAAATVQLAQLFSALSPHVMLRGTKALEHAATMRGVVGATLRRVMVQHHIHDVFLRLPAALESIPAAVLINGKARRTASWKRYPNPTPTPTPNP